MEVQVLELYCLNCFQRLCSQKRPQVLYCRHLGCVDCYQSPLQCPICGDLRDHVVVPDNQRLAPMIEHIGNMTNELEASPVAQQANLLQELTKKIEEIKAEIKFQGVVCKFIPTCSFAPNCPYFHESQGLEEFVVLEEDKCARCHQPVQTLSVPFCVHCGYVESVTEGMSVPNPLKPLS